MSLMEIQRIVCGATIVLAVGCGAKSDSGPTATPDVDFSNVPVATNPKDVSNRLTIFAPDCELSASRQRLRTAITTAVPLGLQDQVASVLLPAIEEARRASDPFCLIELSRLTLHGPRIEEVVRESEREIWKQLQRRFADEASTKPTSADVPRVLIQLATSKSEIRDRHFDIARFVNETLGKSGVIFANANDAVAGLVLIDHTETVGQKYNSGTYSQVLESSIFVLNLRVEKLIGPLKIKAEYAPPRIPEWYSGMYENSVLQFEERLHETPVADFVRAALGNRAALESILPLLFDDVDGNRAMVFHFPAALGWNEPTPVEEAYFATSGLISEKTESRLIALGSVSILPARQRLRAIRFSPQANETEVAARLANVLHRLADHQAGATLWTVLQQWPTDGSETDRRCIEDALVALGRQAELLEIRTCLAHAERDGLDQKMREALESLASRLDSRLRSLEQSSDRKSPSQ